MITDEQRSPIISKVNDVKDDIDQLLMFLGANVHGNTIIQKMDELDGRIADLDNYVYECYVDRGSTRALIADCLEGPTEQPQ